MSDCCSKTNKKTSLKCPECGTNCQYVTKRTLYHQVRFPENLQLATEDYFFCPSRHCTIAFFSGSGNSISKSCLISQQALQKDILCYCFDITTACYQSALKIQHADVIKDFIIQRTKLSECACEIRNPSGRCCLAKFKQLENEYATVNSMQDP